MIGYSITGFPRPVGSEFRYRSVFAERSFRGDDHPVPWVVSVVDTLAGPVIEAHNHVDAQAIVATEVDKHSTFGMQDVIAKARDLLDKDGWTMAVVPVCSVAGCDRGRSMWTISGRGIYSDQECLWCEMRTVLACKECGAPDDAQVMQSVREALLRDQLCHTCGIWTARLELNEAKNAVFAKGRMYTIGDGRGPKEVHGFAGAEWVITFTDGRVVETDDLWDGGEVPEWFRDRFPVNATVEAKKR